jgi:uncharacterized protein YcbX
MTIGTIGAILRFPVKSMLGETLDEGLVTSYGLTGDRAHALIDVETGKIASAKQPNLWRDLLQYSSRTANDGAIIVSDPSGNAMDGDAAAALSKLLGREVRLIATRPDGIELNRARPDEVLEDGVDASVTQDLLAIGGAAPDGGFFDFAPIHLMTSASLDAARAAAPNGTIEAARYRPNLLIDSAEPAPFAENGWTGRRIRIGDTLTLEIVAPTPRCAVPMLAHGTLPRSPDAVRVVNRLNKVEFPLLGPGTFPCLGAYATVIAAGSVRIGDQVSLA